MFVTTAGRTNEEMKVHTKEISNKLGIPYIDRRKKGVQALLQSMQCDQCMVVGKERIELHTINEADPLFFHPSSSHFRLKRLLRGEMDPLIEALELEEGMAVLDCTLGMASDSITISHVVGEKGNVVSLEGNRYVALLVEKGLQQWETNFKEMRTAMNNITVICNRYEALLPLLPDDSFDCVYFDPMFDVPVNESEGIQPLRNWAVYDSITEETIKEAKRVAKKRVVLKNHYRSPLFDQFGFTVTKRPSAKFHFGVIELSNNR